MASSSRLAYGGTPTVGQRAIYRFFSITLNHHFYGVDLMIFPFKGVLSDQLDTPHAEIATQYEAGQQ